MVFELAPADKDALSQVDIRIPGVKGNADGGNPPSVNASEESGVVLNSTNLMFPPKVTKDSKSAEWKEWTSGSFEPAKWYVQSKPRQLGLEFEWVVGSFGQGGYFRPDKLRKTLAGIKSFFYGPFFGGDKKDYPAVNIFALYDIIRFGEKANNGKWASFRIMDVSIKYSEQLAKIKDGEGKGRWYPLHTKLSMNLEGASQIGSTSEVGKEFVQKRVGPMGSFGNLPNRPRFEWF